MLKGKVLEWLSATTINGEGQVVCRRSYQAPYEWMLQKRAFI
ncbi:MAG: hypothetical protein THHGLFOP_001300 [Candidatus Fervidibacter sp.]